MGVPFSPLRTCPPASSDLAVTAPAWVGVAAVERVQREVQGVAAAVVPAALEIVRQDALARLPGLQPRHGVHPRSSGLFGLRPSWSASSFVASPIGSLIRLPSGMPFGVLPTRSPSCTATLPTFAVARRRSLPWPARSSKTWSLSSAAVAVPTLWLRRSQWTRSHRLRTLAEVSVEVELRGAPITPIYQRIAHEAARLHEGGLTLKAVAEHFAVDDHTAAKAVRCFRQRF